MWEIAAMYIVLTSINTVHSCQLTWKLTQPVCLMCIAEFYFGQWKETSSTTEAQMTMQNIIFLYQDIISYIIFL